MIVWYMREGVAFVMPVGASLPAGGRVSGTEIP